MSNSRRPFQYALVASLGLAVLSIEARANDIIPDPAMGVERDAFSDPILVGVTFLPAPSGGGVFGFYNPLSQNITEMMFQTYIAPNLSPPLVQSAFTCNEGASNPFFQQCSVQYLPSTGLLALGFYGTYPVTANPDPVDEVGLQMGIPPLLAGCLAHPDQPGCDDVGHFAITLNDDFSLSGLDGSWNNTKSPGLFTSEGPSFTAADISTVFGATPPTISDVPEPAEQVLLGMGLIALGWLGKRHTSARAAFRRYFRSN